jgi:hypothetical protein
MNRFITRRDNTPNKLDREPVAAKAIERAEHLSTAELTDWVESIGAGVALQLGSYSAHRGDDTPLYEARRQCEVLHGVLTVLISRT